MSRWIVVRTVGGLIGLILMWPSDASAQSALVPNSVWPVGVSTAIPSEDAPNPNGYYITTPFQADEGHTGVDLANGAGGGEVRAVAGGRVVKKLESTSGWGYMVRIRHVLPSGIYVYTQYAHMEAGSILVDEGDWVDTSEPIGRVGNTGRVFGLTGLHLHFEVKLIDSNGCGYLPSSLCSQDSFANYLDPLVFVGASSPLSIDHFETVPVVGNHNQTLTVHGSGFRTGMIALVTLPDQSTVSVGTAAIRVIASDRAELDVRLMNEGSYAFRFEERSQCECESNLVGVRVHPPIDAKDHLFLDVFDIDDALRVSLNGNLIGTVGYFGIDTFDLTSHLATGTNTLRLELENGRDGGWTYGFNVRTVGTTIHRECGVIGTVGCEDDDMTRGVVFVDTFVLQWSGVVGGIRTPAPHFTMSSGGSSANDGGLFQVRADSTGTAAVTFTDTSDPGNGVPILSRTWTIEGVSDNFQDAQFTYAFPPGPPRTITLTLTVPGATFSASGVVDVAAPSSLTSFFDGSGDPRFQNSSFEEPRMDSQGNLILAKLDRFGSTCGGNFCQPFTIVSISPTGAVNWEAAEGAPGIPYVGSDVFATRGIAIGLNDDVFVASSRNEVSAYRNGHLIPGWPVRIDFQGALTTVQVPSVHPVTGDIFMWTRPTFVGTLATSVVLSANGAERLRLTGGIAGAWLFGPQGDPFISATSGALARFDAQALGILCQGHSPYNVFGTPIPYVWGASEGLFGVLNSLLFKADGACASSNLVTLPGSSFAMIGTGQGRAFGFEYDGSPVTPTNPKLVGVRLTDGATWRQQDIAPGGNRFRVYGGLVYVLGLDRSDALRPKLFAVDAQTGAILSRVDTGGICGRCGLSVAPDGSVYVNDLNSTKIFRIVN